MAINSGKRRGKWGSKPQFLLACIGYVVGLGNVLRFPYLCYVNGGGAFLIPYFVTMVLLGVPLLYMEMSVGQLTRLGPVHALAKLCPLLKGTGVAMAVSSFIVCIYHNVFIAWALYYLFHSFSDPLPWTYCDNNWKDNTCRSSHENQISIPPNEISTDADYVGFEYGNESIDPYFTLHNSPSFQYFNNRVLAMSTGLEDFGSLRVELVGCLFLAWFIVYWSVFKGVKSIGKVVYFTALLPYVILIILLVRTVTLPGAVDGIRFLFAPDWHALLRPQIWIAAAVQNFYSIGIGFGSLVVFSSYNRKDNNIYHDTLTIVIVNGFTSILSALFVFSALGVIARTLGVNVAEATATGPELVFVVIPSLFTHLPVPNLWAVLYFLMLICLGIDSQFGYVEIINTTIVDHFQYALENLPRRRELVALAVCVTCFVLGLPYVTEGGIYFFVLVDYYAAVISIAYFEVMAVWLFGGNRLAREISFLSGYRPYYFFPFCWVFISPFLITVISSNRYYHFTLVQYGGYLYPRWAQALGVFISLTSIIWIPIGIIHTCCANNGACGQKFKKSLTPTFLPEHMKNSNQSEEVRPLQIEMQPQFSSAAVTEPLIIEGANASAPPPAEVSTQPPDYETAATMVYPELP